MKRRIIEISKNILIFVLLCSAVYLLILANSGAGVASTLLSYISGQKTPTEAPTISTSAAAWPVGLAVMNENGRFGVLYNSELITEYYSELGSILGEALGTMGEPEASNLDTLEDVLSDISIYFEYPGKIPLSALAEWLGTGTKTNGILASRLILSLTGSQSGAILYYIQDDVVYAAATDIDIESVLQTISAYRPNDTSFAFELAESTAGYEDINPITLVPAAISLPSVESTLATAQMRDLVVSSLGFNPYSSESSYTDPAGTEIFTGNNSQLQIEADGDVIFNNRDTSSSRFKIQTLSQSPSDAEVIEAARSIICDDIDPGGDAVVMLTSFEETGDGSYYLGFDYFISGAKVKIGSGPAITASIENYTLTELNIALRIYHVTNQESDLLPVNQAAVITSGELVAEYFDTGAATLSAGWKQ